MSLIVRKEEFISLVFSFELQCCPLSEVVCFRLSCSFQGQGQCLCANSSYLGQNVFLLRTQLDYCYFQLYVRNVQNVVPVEPD